MANIAIWDMKTSPTSGVYHSLNSYRVKRKGVRVLGHAPAQPPAVATNSLCAGKEKRTLRKQ